MPSLATIGYQGASLEGFLETLTDAGVGVVIDVREAPYSKRQEFCKKELNEALGGAGIEYVHLGGLGNPPEGREAAREGRDGDFQTIFAAHMTTDAYRDDMNRAVKIAENGAACLMCTERDVNHCHRKIVAEGVSFVLDMEVRNLVVPKNPGQGDLFGEE